MHSQPPFPHYRVGCHPGSQIDPHANTTYVQIGPSSGRHGRQSQHRQQWHAAEYNHTDVRQALKTEARERRMGAQAALNEGFIVALVKREHSTQDV